MHYALLTFGIPTIASDNGIDVKSHGCCPESNRDEGEAVVHSDPIVRDSTLNDVLENRQGLKVAVIVNDMAEVNVDASLIVDQGTLVHTEEKMVALQNGCICCTLREDLFVELSKLAAMPDGGLDHIIIESSGISEPMPVAETFTFKDSSGTSLSDVAMLDTLVTVVDGATFLNELYAADALRSRGWEASAEDERTVAQLFCDQLEFVNVISQIR